MVTAESQYNSLVLVSIYVCIIREMNDNPTPIALYRELQFLGRQKLPDF